MAVIDCWNGPLSLVVIFFALCLLLLAWSIAGVACRACHSSGIFLKIFLKKKNLFISVLSLGKKGQKETIILKRAKVKNQWEWQLPRKKWLKRCAQKDFDGQKKNSIALASTYKGKNPKVVREVNNNRQKSGIHGKKRQKTKQNTRTASTRVLLVC